MFHTEGPAAEKLLLPKLWYVPGTMQILSDKEWTKAEDSLCWQ